MIVPLLWVVLAAIPGSTGTAGGTGSTGPAGVVAAAPPTAPADADAPTVTARPDKAEVRVGDPIAITVTAVGPRGTPVNLPGTLELGPFSLLQRREEEKDLGDGKFRRDFVLSVAAYEPGEIQFPAIEVTYLGKTGDVRTARTAPLPIKISSLLANEPEPALKENAAPVVVLQQNLTIIYVTCGLVAALLGGLIALAVRKRMKLRQSQRPGPPPRPAHEVALERLDRLGASAFAQDQDLRPFTFALSEIIREYVGARFGFDSLELTTEELLAQLARRTVRGLVMGEVEGWLSASDLIKFAKISPSAAEARGALETAIRIVESTRPRPEPIGPPAGPHSPQAGGGLA